MTGSPGLAQRRVVTGLDAEGRSTVIIDAPVPKASNGATQLVWRAASVPADNAGSADASIPFSIDHLKDGSSPFFVVELPVGIPRHMHATDTLDYLVILSGQIVLEMETGEVVLGPGDMIVQRGTLHAWRNDGPEPVRMISINLPSIPVGGGATI